MAEYLEFKRYKKETHAEYFATYDYLVEKQEWLDKIIEELASGDKYKEKVKHVEYFIGIKTHTALSMVVEIGDFNRFEKVPKFAGFLGLVSSEDSNGDNTKRYSITKEGNGHLRRLMVEVTQKNYTRENIGYKSIVLKQR